MKQLNTCIENECSEPARNKRKPGRCDACYMRLDYRQRKFCGAEGCTYKLTPEKRTTRADYCRPHEGLLFAEWAESDHLSAWQALQRNTAYRADTGCWEWTNGTEQGYARAHWPHDLRMTAHRFAYVWTYGGHAPRLELDHLCSRSTCCNPLHLHPVRGTVNTKFRDERLTNPGEGMTWWPEDRDRVPLEKNAPDKLFMMSIRVGLPLYPGAGFITH